MIFFQPIFLLAKNFDFTNFFKVAFLLGYYWIDAILFFIGVIVANVPESLLVVFTISLSVSATRLSKRFAHTILKIG